MVDRFDLFVMFSEIDQENVVGARRSPEGAWCNYESGHEALEASHAALAKRVERLEKEVAGCERALEHSEKIIREVVTESAFVTPSVRAKLERLLPENCLALVASELVKKVRAPRDGDGQEGEA